MLLIIFLSASIDIKAVQGFLFSLTLWREGRRGAGKEGGVLGRKEGCSEGRRGAAGGGHFHARAQSSYMRNYLENNLCLTTLPIM